jgi:hypothetical protein
MRFGLCGQKFFIIVLYYVLITNKIGFCCIDEIVFIKINENQWERY